MNPLLGYVASHLLSIIEAELVSNAPEIIEITEKEIELLITKLESYIGKKSPAAAAIATPILNAVDTVANTAIPTAVNNLVGSIKS